jgi:hypothetical protein
MLLETLLAIDDSLQVVEDNGLESTKVLRELIEF